MQLRDSSQIRRPGRYSEDYDLGDPGRPIFVHPDVPFNKELAKHVEFNSLPPNHPGPAPSRMRYEAAQKGNLKPAAQIYPSANAITQRSQVAKVVSLARPDPRERIVPSIEYDEDENGKLNKSLRRLWQTSGPAKMPKQPTVARKAPEWAELSDGTKLVIMSDLTIVRKLTFTQAARSILGLTQDAAEEFLELYRREWSKQNAYDCEIFEFNRKRMRTLSSGAQPKGYVIPLPDLVTNTMTAKELKKGRLFLDWIGAKKTAAGLGRWEGQGTDLVPINFEPLPPPEVGWARPGPVEPSMSAAAPAPAPARSPNPAAAPSPTSVAPYQAPPTPTPKRPVGRPRKVVQHNVPQVVPQKRSRSRNVIVSGTTVTLPLPPVSLNTVKQPRQAVEKAVSFQPTVETTTFSTSEPVAAKAATFQQRMSTTPSRERFIIEISSDDEGGEEKDTEQAAIPSISQPPKPARGRSGAVKLPKIPEREVVYQSLSYSFRRKVPQIQQEDTPTGSQPQPASPIVELPPKEEDEDYIPPGELLPNTRRPRSSAPRRSRARPGARRGRPPKNPPSSAPIASGEPMHVPGHGKPLHLLPVRDSNGAHDVG